MNHPSYSSVTQTESALQEGRRVLRNTYMLLSITLLFSAGMAWLAMALNIRFLHPLIFLVGAYGLMFLVSYTARTALGLVAILAFTGFMGFSLGPVLNLFMHSAGGASVVTMALSTTGVAFLGLSAVAIFTRRDLSFLSSFITVGVIVLLAGMIISLFTQVSGLSMALSGGFVLLSSAVILLRTQQIVRGGQDNYILATIDLYVSIYNMFISLLQLFSPRN